MKFIPGDLVLIINTVGRILEDHPPALIISGSMGHIIKPCPGIEEEREEIYTILRSGVIDSKVSGDWMIKVDELYQLED